MRWSNADNSVAKSHWVRFARGLCTAALLTAFVVATLVCLGGNLWSAASAALPASSDSAVASSEGLLALDAPGWTVARAKARKSALERIAAGPTSGNVVILDDWRFTSGPGLGGPHTNGGK